MVRIISIIICVVLFLSLFSGCFKYSRIKYDLTCCKEENIKLLHRKSNNIVVKPTVITSVIEKDYWYGIRFNAYNWKCPNVYSVGRLRVETPAIYFVLDMSKGKVKIFEPENEKPIEFLDRKEFESYLNTIGMEKVDKVNYRQVAIWEDLIKRRYDNENDRACFADGFLGKLK